MEEEQQDVEHQIWYLLLMYEINNIYCEAENNGVYNLFWRV